MNHSFKFYRDMNVFLSLVQLSRSLFILFLCIYIVLHNNTILFIPQKGHQILHSSVAIKGGGRSRHQSSGSVIVSNKLEDQAEVTYAGGHIFPSSVMIILNVNIKYLLEQNNINPSTSTSTCGLLQRELTS